MKRTNISKANVITPKNIVIAFLIAVITITSIKIHTASAMVFMPIVPTFTTITRSVYDVVKDNGFTIPKTVEEIAVEVEVEEEVQESLAVKYSKSNLSTSISSLNESFGLQAVSIVKNIKRAMNLLFI